MRSRFLFFKYAHSGLCKCLQNRKIQARSKKRPSIRALLRMFIKLIYRTSLKRDSVQDEIQEKCRWDARIGRKTYIILYQSYILHLILHPILHPKSSVNTGQLIMWCRKCRRFSKNFFCGGRGIAVRKMQNNSVRKMQNIGLLWAKVRMFYIKSTDVCLKEVRCFCFPENAR